MKRVYLDRNHPEMLPILKGLLEEEGIRVVTQDEFSARSAILRTSLWVKDEDYQRALEVIRQNEPTPQTCPNCGYDLWGLPEPRCPECGEPFHRREKPPPPWKCPNCGEEIEGQFTACWKCGYEQPIDVKNK
jgi:rubrerythrin